MASKEFGTFRNHLTGEVLELTPPDEFGFGTVLYNGRVVETCMYAEGAITTEDGKIFRSGREWAKYLADGMCDGKWKTMEAPDAR